MAEQIDGTGVITKTSSNSCVVSVTINGTSKLFIFHKSLFYTFGVRCEGSMTNILEDGVEVELCYKVSHPEGKCCILAVWLGEKPDIMMKDEKSKAIYEASGRVVSSYDNDNYLIRGEHDNTVCINKGVVFRDGLLLPDVGTLTIDEELYFDALPFESEHPSGATLNATCAWCGPRPKVIDRFDLRPRDETEFPDGIVEGTVAVIPNDIVAIVDVVTDLGLTKVLLFRSSFRRDGALLGNVVDVGDCVGMRLGFRTVFRGCKWWYALKAVKRSDEIRDQVDFDSVTNLCEEVTSEIDALNIDSVDKIKLSNSSAPLPYPVSRLNESGSSFRDVSSKVPPEVTPTLSLLTKKCLLQGRGFLLNCSGKFVAEVDGNLVKAQVKHTVGSSVVAISMTSVTSSSPKSEQYLKLNNSHVRFDALCDRSLFGKLQFGAIVLRNKDGHREDDPIEESLLLGSSVEVPSATVGTIKMMLLRNSALAMFDDVPVLVTLESLASVEEINLQTATIDNYLSIGDKIFARIEKNVFEGRSYLKAVQCFVGENVPSDPNLSRKMKSPRRMTWNDAWGLGETYRKEPIVYKNGKFLVMFVSVKRPNVVCELDLFEKKKVFVDGKRADMEMLKAYVGHEITFHAAHKHSDSLEDSSKGMSVACAWIGEEPHPKLVLKSLLAVPKGLICPPWRYEAVVSFFPFPAHAFCHIGHVPILVAIGDSHGCKIADLAVGDRLFVSAYESMIEDTCVILSNDLMNLRRVRDVELKEVYKSLPGTIVALPEPVGKIRVDIGLEVSFELCHLRFVKKRPNMTNKKRFSDVRNKNNIGKQVYVSAVKTTSKTTPYRAFEVYFNQ